NGLSEVECVISKTWTFKPPARNPKAFHALRFLKKMLKHDSRIDVFSFLRGFRVDYHLPLISSDPNHS
ncbi:MAG: hypothetical protein VYB72_04180, partial [Planctomycetota bacterium]|nr:hypothetical protein [Planctomycetota bacterium]